MPRPHGILTEYYATEAGRSAFVRRLFDEAARDYDRLNALFSFGTGRAYRRRALRRAGLPPGAVVLDVASGTGLLAAEAVRIAGETGQVVALDMSWGMLQRARTVAGLALIQGSADRLPFRDARFDMLTVGYALRHVATLETAFAEFRRVLRPGGRLLLLEIGRPRSRIGRALLQLYLGRAVPWLSHLLGRTDQANRLTRYYWDTIETCVPPEAIVAALGAADFAEARCTTELGVFHAYTASRPD